MRVDCVSEIGRAGPRVSLFSLLSSLSFSLYFLHHWKTPPFLPYLHRRSFCLIWPAACLPPHSDSQLHMPQALQITHTKHASAQAPYGALFRNHEDAILVVATGRQADLIKNVSSRRCKMKVKRHEKWRAWRPLLSSTCWPRPPFSCNIVCCIRAVLLSDSRLSARVSVSVDHVSVTGLRLYHCVPRRSAAVLCPQRWGYRL